MRRPLFTLSRLFPVLALFSATLALFWTGMVPQRLSPFAPLALDQSEQWFLDPKIAALKRDPALCRAVLKAPHVEAAPIPDLPIENGCGARNSVRLSAAGGAKLPADRLSCEMAAALALWLEHAVQPLAVAHFGARVAKVQHMGAYACRNIIGSVFWKDVRSQHAKANAIDIGAFTLTDGRRISILKSWHGNGPEARFLHDVHARACRIFRVVLGPDFNTAHKDHFHFDRSLIKTCR
jgi:hypothetical protein